VAPVTNFGFPFELSLSLTDIRALLYRVFMHLQDEFAERAVHLKLDIAPEVNHAVMNQLKLREVFPGLAVQGPQRAARARRQAGAVRPDL
jgi:hypothetical protein